MERSLIKTLRDSVGKEVRIDATIDVIRNQGKVAFIEFKDRSSSIQGVVFGKPEVLEVAKDLTEQSAVRVHGVVNERPEKMRNEKAENGDIELEITALEPLSKAEALPFDLNDDFTIETLLDYRPLTLRRKRDRAIFKVQHEILRAYRETLTKEEFVEFEAPKIVGDDAEGGAGVFQLEYLKGRTAFLATSPQLYKQIMVGVFERVFSIGPVFRGEKHSTSRHLNEYISLDAELGFIEDHHDVMKALTTVMRYMIEHLEKTSQKEFTYLNAELPKCPETIPSMKLREAQELIYEKTGEDCRKEKDLTPEHERWLSEYAREAHDTDFIFITHFPTEKAAFYAYDDPEDEGYTKYFDLLFRGVEIVSGGQRMHEPEKIVEKLKAKNLDPENFSYYLQAFRYGIPPHGGWGMGLERLTQKFLGLKNVKEAALFPRDVNRIDQLLSKEHNDETEDSNNE